MYPVRIRYNLTWKPEKVMGANVEAPMDTEKSWSDVEIRAIFERVLEKHLDALMASLSASEIPAAKEAYLRAFDLIFEQQPVEEHAAAFESAAALEEAAGKIVDAVLALGPPDPARILRDWRLLREMGPLIGYVYDTARQVVRREVQVTPDIREKLESTYRRLHELEATIRSDCPYLLDKRAESPRPALWLNSPRGTSQRLADAFLDCRFILGQTRAMSLHLGHDYQAAQERAKPA